MDSKQRSESNRNFNDALHQVLKAELGMALKMVTAARPADPIEFLGTHLRHLRCEGGAIHVKGCATCEELKAKVINARVPSAQLSIFQVPATALVASASSALTKADKFVIEKCEKENWFAVDHWRKVQIVDCWADLTKKYNKELKWWHVAAAMRSKTIPKIAAIKNRKVWKTIRVFVSSTFKDMFCEREWLVKRVFPELRTWCGERKLFLVECDLRWGMPKDSTSREILAACLNEIDRCREENTMPYFVGLLGERYGWVPSEKEFPDDLRRSYCWIPGMSVTSLEMMAGVLWDNNPNAIMLIRSGDFQKKTDQLITTLNKKDQEAVTSSYRESDESNKQSINMLHQLVRACLPASQVFSYPADVDGLISDGSNRMNIVGLQDFGARVLSHLKSTIAAQFESLSTEQLSSMEIQHSEHEQFMAQRSRVLFGRDSEVGQITTYIKNASDADVPVLTISGSAGTGKSSLMAHVAEKCAADSSYKVVVHFVGATRSSTTLYRILSRLWYECLNLPEDSIPTEFEELKHSLDSVFRRASQNVKQKGLARLVVFIDALNQMDDDSDSLDLLWLPKSVPSNVRVIVSTLEGKCLDALRAAKLSEMKVEPLSVEWRKQVIVQYLKDFNKKMSDAQVNSLLKHVDSGRPLWLTLACEELRVFGTFEFLDKKVAAMVSTSDLQGLVKHILERVISETVVGGDLMQAALSLIAVSRFGLTEAELCELLVMEPTLPSDEEKLKCITKEHEPFPKDMEKLPMQTWAVLNLDLRQFLRPVGSSGDGRLDFYHRSISKVVQSMMFQPTEEPEEEMPKSRRTNAERPKPTHLQTLWHERVAAYFKKRVYSSRRKVEELPYHYIQMENQNGMRSLFYNPFTFDALYKEDTKAQLLSYSRVAGTYDDISEMLMDAKEKWVHKLVGRERTITAEAEKVVSRSGSSMGFAVKVKGFSSQHETDSWKRIIDNPRVYPEHKLSSEAWAPRKGGNKEFIELQFEEPAYITGVVVYETFNPGAVTKISARNKQNQWEELYCGKAEWIRYSRIFCPEITPTKYKSNTIRLDIDASVCNGFVQIDAVQLLGFDNLEQLEKYQKKREKKRRRRANLDDAAVRKRNLSKQWINRIVSFSSQYSEEEGAAVKMIGRRAVYPDPSNYGNAWHTKKYDYKDRKTVDFVEFAFKDPVYVWEMVVYETCNGGGLLRVLAKDVGGKWQEIYVAEILQKIPCSRKFRPKLQRPRFKTDTFRLEISQLFAENQVHIDAVKIYGFANLQELEQAEQEELEDFKNGGTVIEQYANKVIRVSSARENTTSHLPKYILGPPNSAGNYEENSWSPKWSQPSKKEFIELEYAKQVYITSVAIYEMCSIGCVTQVSARNASGSWVPIYKGEAKHLEVGGCGRTFRPKITPPDFKTNAIRLDILTSANAEEDECMRISAVAIYGSECVPVETAQRSTITTDKQAGGKADAAAKPTQKSSIKAVPLLKQWVYSISEFTCDGGDETPMHVLGAPQHFPLYGHNPEWTPPEGATKYSFEFTYEKPVFVAAFEIYETYHAGGVSKISARNPAGKWDTIYKADAIQDIAQSRKFVPKITRPKYKASEFLIEFSHKEAAPEWVEIDAIALHGLESERPPEQDLIIDDFAADDETDTAEIKEQKISAMKERESEFGNIFQYEHVLLNVKNTRFERWLNVVVKLGWFFIDIGEFETAVKHLNSITLVIEARDGLQCYSRTTANILRKKAEIYHALVVLYRTLLTKFTSETVEVARRNRNLGTETSELCYEMHLRCWPKDDLHFGEVAAACSFFVPELRDETIKLFERKSYTRGLVDLYALKGTETQNGEPSVTRGYHEKAIKLAYSEFGQFHLQTARAHQLFGQSLLHRYALIPNEKTPRQLEEAYQHYAAELQIVETALGKKHAFAVRSREDNITVLTKLGKANQAAELRKKQPSRR